MQPSLLVYHERTPLQDPRLGISQTITQALAPNQSLVLTHNEIPALQISVTDDMTNTVTVTSSTETANTERQTRIQMARMPPCKRFRPRPLPRERRGSK